MQRESDLFKKWEFEWPLMEVLIGGKSSIDILQLFVRTEAEAEKFLESYGYNLKSLKDQKKIDALFIEACHFISTHLMPRQWKAGLRPPKELMTLKDPKLLLLYASNEDKAFADHQKWACAIIKIMHTLSHIDNLERLSKLKEAQAQIIKRFEHAIFRGPDGKLCFGQKDECIELVKLEWKHEKTRQSIILKLLHKPINVSETIYDLLGIRLVTKTQADALVAVKFLRKFYLIDFPNTHPGRARNSLVNLEEFKSRLEVLLDDLGEGELKEEEFLEYLHKLNCPARESRRDNPHTSDSYKAIALTCRQRIKYQSRELKRWYKIKDWLDQHNDDGRYDRYRTLIDTLIGNPSDTSVERSTFFPFEVQILDASSARMSEHGIASHDYYKGQQLRTARRRILGSILTKSRFL